MKLTFFFSALAAVLIGLLSGCGKISDETPSLRPEDPNVSLANLPPLNISATTTDALVVVNGQALTFVDAQLEVGMRMAAVTNRNLPPGGLDAVRRQVLGTIAEQFVLRKLLLAEADRRGIEVTPQDEVRAFDRIREKLPPGTSFEETMKNSPMGEKRMREEVMTGIRIDKLLSAELTNQPPVTDADIAEFVQQNSSLTNLPESVRVRHILLSVDASADPETRRAKRTEIESIRSALLEGADFTATARSRSDCPSKNRGGDLGTFSRGQMVKPFEDAAFSQKEGEIGPIVETEYGYHIIKVEEHRGAGPIARADVERIISARRSRERMHSLLSRLKQKADIRYSPEAQQIGPPPTLR